MRKRFGFVLAAIAASLAVGVSAAAESAGTEGSETIAIGMPFNGLWASSFLHDNDCGRAKDPVSHPACHHTPGKGDWAVDVYAMDEDVRANVGSSTGTLSLVVESVRATSCGAGQNIRIRMRVDEVDAGWVSYAHLETVLKARDKVNPGDSLGRVRYWGNKGKGSCYHVTTPAGAHVHIEVANHNPRTNGFSCYLDLGKPGSRMISPGTTIGRLGNTGTTNRRRPCALTSGKSGISRGPLILVSATRSGATGNRESGNPSWSPDGARIAFESYASNLVEGDANKTSDIFVRNLRTGAMTLLTGEAGVKANNYSSSPTWNPDGSRVAFDSYATNLVARDTNQASDVFVKDIRTGRLSLVSTARDGRGANGNSYAPSWSPDGASIAFASDASNLVSEPSPGTFDVFVKNLRTGLVQQISHISDNVDRFTPPVWSPDSTRVAFLSSVYQIYVAHVRSKRITLVSSTSAGIPGNDGSFDPAWSPDGTKIAFASQAQNLGSWEEGSTVVVAKDLRTRTVKLISPNDARISPDGGLSKGPAWSPDGTQIAFESDSPSLVGGTSGSHIFVKNLQSGANTLVSASTSGRGGNQYSYGAQWSRDGTKLAFDSLATNLVPSDRNRKEDVFVKVLGG